MKTRRSERLSKQPLSQQKKKNYYESESDGSSSERENLRKSSTCVNEEKKACPPHEVNSINSSQGGAKFNTNVVDFGESTIKNGLDKDGNTSDSSDDYMKTPIDLNSDFFKVECKKEKEASDFLDIEKKIFSGVKQLSDSDGSSDLEDVGFTHEYIHIPLPNETSRKDIHNKFRKKTSRKKKEENLCNSTVKTDEKEADGIKADLSTMDVSQLLALGETQGPGSDEEKEKLKCKKETDDEVSDWEEVEEQQTAEVEAEQHSFPKEGVQILVDAPDLYQKRREKGFDMETYLKRRMNRVKREIQVLVHKVHLLCWIAHGRFVNSLLNSEVLMGLSLSLIPSQHCYPKTVNAIYLKHLVGWFIKTVVVKEVPASKQPSVPLHDSLQKQFNCLVANSKRDLVLMFVCLLRSLGLNARLVISLQPVRLKPSSSELATVSGNKSPPVKKKSEVKPTESKAEGGAAGKSRGRKKSVKALSAKEAEQVQKSRKVMSKEEAVELLKKGAGSAKEKVAQPKKNNSSNNVQPGKKQSDAEKPRRSLRAKKESTKYKDVTDSSDAEDSENEPSSSAKNKEERFDARENVKKRTKGQTNDDKKERGELSQASEGESPTKRSRLSEDCGEGISVKHKTPEGPLRKHRNLTKKRNNSAVKENKTSEKDALSDVNSADDKEAKKSRTSVTERKMRSSARNTLKSNVGKPDNLGKSLNGNVRKSSQSNLKDEVQNTANSGDEFMSSINQPSTSSSKKVLVKRKPEKVEANSDSDFEHEKSEKILKSRKSNIKVDRRVLSSDTEDDNVRVKNNFWVEVLLDSKTWISLNVISGNVDCIGELYNNALKPVTYVVAWNPDNTLKDVTRRYCSKFHSETRKLRVEEKWWKESLAPFRAPRNALDRKEDKDMEKQIEEMPLPKSITEYKNHPLYVLKRHLLKFQAIYPPDAPTLGFVRGEPVYARDCVYTLHSREIWLKDAKTVKLGEQPYKIVKARPKYDRMSGKVITDLPLEIFGVWQVEDYVPPTAVGGKVPRNAYGNVELFKPSMLPKGTVHLQVPGLNRVAKKLGIDCAPAVVGFDFHCGASHPTYDGFVVCEEFQDILLDAWERDQEEAVRREQEKRDKRVYGNWRRLIKGLMIRERLNLKYAFGGEEEEEEEKEEEKKVAPTKKPPQGKSSSKAKGRGAKKPKKSSSEDDSDWGDA